MASLPLSNNVRSLSHDGTRIFENLEAYLQPSSTTPAAAIAEEINSSANNILQSAEPDIEGFLWEAWKVFIAIAKQLPSDHPSQDRLVDVVRALVEIPPTMIQIWEKDARLWTDLPLLGPSMREAWTLSPNLTEHQIATWINLNAFAARLFTLDSISWVNFPIWTLRSALEEESSGRKLKCDVQAAAEWIARCGDLIFQHATTSTADNDGALRGGSLYNGPGGMSMERWRFWRERFGEISASEDAVRETCAMAMNAMENIEQTR